MEDRQVSQKVGRRLRGSGRGVVRRIVAFRADASRRAIATQRGGFSFTSSS